MEAQCYVIAAAQAGKHNEKRESWGHSLVVDPWGTVVAHLDSMDATGDLRCWHCTKCSQPCAPIAVKLWYEVRSLLQPSGPQGAAASLCTQAAVSCAGIITAELDWALMAKLRERMPISEHRRQGRLCLGWDSISPGTPAQELPAGVIPELVKNKAQ